MDAKEQLTELILQNEEARAAYLVERARIFPQGDGIPDVDELNAFVRRFPVRGGLRPDLPDGVAPGGPDDPRRPNAGNGNGPRR